MYIGILMTWNMKRMGIQVVSKTLRGKWVMVVGKRQREGGERREPEGREGLRERKRGREGGTGGREGGERREGRESNSMCHIYRHIDDLEHEKNGYC
jgi:hypothetical protein